MPEIRHMLDLAADTRTVYRALAEQEGLASWWTREASAEPVEGSVAEFRFGSRDRVKMRITRLVENRRVEWECLEGHEEWVGTTLRYDLESVNGGTRLRFTHGAWREATDFMAACNYHWGRYLFSLKALCETGRGHPYEASAG